MTDDVQFTEALDPADAFATLADETRVDILRALWEADSQTARFSTLREAVGSKDSGRFNYHLGTLTGHFVRETEEGYALTVAGRHVVGGLLQGAYTQTGSIDPIPLDRPCSVCGGERTFRYEDETVRIDCSGCQLVMRYETPPGVFAGYDRETVPAVARDYLRSALYRADGGFCPFCEGAFEPAVRPADAAAIPFETAFPVVEYTCRRCEESLVTDLGTALLFEPAVVAFHADHDVDVREGPLDRFIRINDAAESLSDTAGPEAAAVTYTTGDERLRVTVDDGCSVLHTERLPTDG